MLTWDPMEAKTSKRYSFLKSLFNLFKLFLNFLLSGSDKSIVLDFWNFEFLNFDDFRSVWLMKFVRRLSSVVCVAIISAPIIYMYMHWFLWNFGCCFPHAIRRGNYFIFWKRNFYFFCKYFSFSFSKRYSFYKSQPKVVKLLLNFLPNGAHKNTVLDFWNFEFSIFNDFFSKISNLPL